MITRTDALPGAQEVINGLYLGHSWRRDSALGKLGEPLSSNARTICDFALGEFTLIDQFVCTLQKVHGPILEKFYRLCKQNFPGVTCENGGKWENTIKIILQKAWRRLAAQRIPS
jgi:hypothetical protein